MVFGVRILSAHIDDFNKRICKGEIFQKYFLTYFCLSLCAVHMCSRLVGGIVGRQQ